MTYFIIGATLSTAIYIFAFALARADPRTAISTRRPLPSSMRRRWRGALRQRV